MRVRTKEGELTDTFHLGEVFEPVRVEGDVRGLESVSFLVVAIKWKLTIVMRVTLTVLVWHRTQSRYTSGRRKDPGSLPVNADVTLPGGSKKDLSGALLRPGAVVFYRAYSRRLVK